MPPFVRSRRRMRPIVPALALVLLACGERPSAPVADKSPVEETKTPATKEPPVVAVVPPTEKAAVDTGDSGVSPQADEGPAALADTGVLADTGALADTGQAGSAPEPVADPKALLKSVQNSRTTDAKAMEALVAAEESGATSKELSRAAFARAKKLHRYPDRAVRFYQWAADKDPKYPDPLFELARQAAVTGDVDIVKENLRQVAARKGNKLLGQIEFDPTWEIVKDDPEVRALLP